MSETVSAELLRRAASLMRERAEASRPAPWVQNGRNGIHTAVGQCIATTHSHEDDRRKAEAVHIASFATPAVALAVADWLDACAGSYHPDFGSLRHEGAFSVARAYLGEPS